MLVVACIVLALWSPSYRVYDWVWPGDLLVHPTSQTSSLPVFTQADSFDWYKVRAASPKPYLIVHSHPNRKIHALTHALSVFTAQAL